MTREEADVALYLVDELVKRGATVVNVAGVQASFAPKAALPDQNRPIKPVKTERERLFGRLGIGDAKPAKAQQ